MDYLDPKKEARHRNILYTGYILIAVAITLTTIILLNQAYGFGFGKNGQLIQNGLVYFSSQPNPASIYINGTLNSSTTNTRLYLPEGIYKVSLSRSGYYDWQRTVEVDGGGVTHFDYPLLFPKTLDTANQQTYANAPAITTQSPDQRWLVVSKPGSFSSFDLYDLKSATKTSKPTVTSFSLPSGVLSKASGGESLKLVEWSDDNQHILLEHDYNGKSEFILIDRPDPTQSVNLNSSLGANPTKLTLKNKKYDQYYIYDAAAHSLQSASLASTAKISVAQHVLAYQSYGNDTLLYVTDSDSPPAGKVWLRMLSGGKVYNLNSLAASPSYVIDLTEYSGTMYVAAGASNSSTVFIYKDPLGQLAEAPDQPVVPTQVLRVDQPNYLSFSNNAQFIVAEDGAQFGVYDIENQKGYNYTTPTVPDAPMIHASWMDGDRLYYVSGGKLDVFDYDNTNRHDLAPASSQYLADFAPDYKSVFLIAPGAGGQYELTRTWLLVLADR